MLLLGALTACATPPSRDSETGESLYAAFCAACHGEDARGDGVLKPYLKVAAPDLTLIAARRNGQFPQQDIYRIIDGQSSDDNAHRHMPLWGYEFYGEDADDQKAHQRASERVSSLVAYLEHIQRAR